MVRQIHYLLLALVFLFCSCKNEQKNTYAIKDFRKSIQPFLNEIVTIGIVTNHDRKKIGGITDEELFQLSRSENPILRATAIEEMFDRSSFNHFDILMNHLNDTAIVATDNGEFGIRLETVSDYLIGRSTWESAQARDMTIEAVLTKHNYLGSAFNILLIIGAQEKFYPYVKDMATRPRRLDSYEEGYELGFDDIEYALYGLAKFRKKEDVQIIKNKLLEHVWELSDVSFRLMKEYPDTAYLDVLQVYHRRKFYNFSGIRPHGFTGFKSDKAAPEDFIEALIVQQNDRSAKLLDTMLTNLPMYTCLPDKEYIINFVIEQIWKHPCAAYARLREIVRPKAEEILKGRITVAHDPINFPVDTTERAYRWYY